MIHRKLNRIGLTKRIWVFLLAVGMSLCLLPAGKAYGYAFGEKTNTVDMYVGYFGNTYAYIGTVTEDEMQTYCDCGEWIYSSIDRGGRTRHDVAYGVTMESLLDYVGIDVGSVDIIYFLGTDGDYYAGFSNLFIPRYYYPYLADGYNYNDPGNSNTYVIMSDYDPVPAILAFEDSLTQDAQVDGSFDPDEYRSRMSDVSCLRIVFGQTEWNERATSDSVKCVYEVAVRIKGSPIITTEDVELDYGGTVPLSYYYNVETGYEELNQVIESGLKIWSEDPDVIRWNEEDGTITALQEGAGRIMIEYEDEGEEFLETIMIRVSDQTTKGGDTESGNGSNSQNDPDAGSQTNDNNDPGTDPDNPESTDNPDNPDNQEESADSAPPEALEEQNKPDQQNELASGVGSGTGSGSGGSDFGVGGSSQGGGSGTGDISTGTGSGSGMLSADGSGNADSDLVSDAENSGQGVYLAVGNVAEGSVVGGGESGGGTSGGSGGRTIELDEWPVRYTIILVAALAAMFVVGGTYRSLRFRRETIER